VNEFKEFLLDYEMREKEEEKRRARLIAEGKPDRYPPLNRFTKASEPLAQANSVSPIWGGHTLLWLNSSPIDATWEEKRF
jgi:hypothetical protein